MKGGQTLWNFTRFVTSSRMIWLRELGLLENLEWRLLQWLHFFWNTKVAWKLTYWGRPTPAIFLTVFDIDQSKWFWKVNAWLSNQAHNIRVKDL